MPNKIEPAQLEQLKIVADRIFCESKADGRNISRRKAYEQVAKAQEMQPVTRLLLTANSISRSFQKL